MAFKFEKLKVWQKALDLANEIDKMTKSFPKEEVYVLTSQVKRAADSISMNIAEGSTGQSNAEFKRFLAYALRSDIEVVNCLHLAKLRAYINQETFDKHYKACEEILAMIVALKIIKLRTIKLFMNNKSSDFGHPTSDSPKSQGYAFPAEWAKHEATWLSWPHKEASWPGKIETIYQPYCEFIKIVATGEKVRINVKDEAMKAFAIAELEKVGADLSQIEFYFNETNDAWCRDHGPAFVVRGNEKAVIDWGYNAWGGKYPPYDLDDVVPTKIAQHFNLPLFTPDIVMEGGSVEFNGAGTILTSTACLLNENRNPHLNKEQIETYLKEFYGAEQILWVGDGIVGDDTDGHIDDITRFVNEDTVLTVLESNPLDENHLLLQENYEALKKMRLIDGRPLNIVKLPMPSPVIYEDTRLPASYANFYIANAAVIVPIFGDVNDQKALDIIQSCFPDRPVVGINSVDIIWGLGSFHCLSQQEPAV